MATSIARSSARGTVSIQWLVRLRWAHIVGQAITIAVAYFILGLPIPLSPLAMLSAVALGSNLLLHANYVQRVGKPVEDWQVAMIMALDIAVLTAMLYFTGGPHNPFGLLYVAQIALAALVLHAQWTWALVGFSFLGYGTLLLGHQPLTLSPRLASIGTWVALGVASAFVVHFLLRMIDALAERERELERARLLAARQERVASLATMAAGAAHELSTPLGTVALAAKELERALSAAGKRGSDAELAADARLIREQVGRCRVILDQMAQGAGTVGEGVGTCTVAELAQDVVAGARKTTEVQVEIAPEVAATVLHLPRVAVVQSLRSLVTNGQDASVAVNSNTPPPVEIRFERRQSKLLVSMKDHGNGMPADVLARAGEPFFTTKSPGQGTGLGLFLARAVLEGVGGKLELDSGPAGTTVMAELPVDVRVK